MNDFLFAFLFFLPAGFANMAPVFASKIPILNKWNYPLDCYQKLNGKRILGDHKTIRGLVVGILVGMIVAAVEFWEINEFAPIRQIIPTAFLQINPLVFGGLIGCGALLGDSVKSFFKRRIGIASGKSWFPFDQLDYIIGGILLTLPIILLPIGIYIWIVVLFFCLHICIAYIGYILRLKDAKI